MKKPGFTLSELLISMAIIGAVSALVAPFISNIIPDQNKPRLLKYYALVSTYTEDMLSNSGIYYAAFATDNEGKIIIPYRASCNGLKCTGVPLVAPYNRTPYTDANFNPVEKYPRILADMMGLQRVIVNAQTHVLTGDLTDRSSWTITPILGVSGYTYRYRIEVDLDNANDSSNCVFNNLTSNNKCLKPDRFRFLVESSGDVNPGDAMTEVFIKNPSRTGKKEDLDEAKAMTKLYG